MGKLELYTHLSYHIQLICENYALNVSLMAIFRNTVSYMIYAPIFLGLLNSLSSMCYNIKAVGINTIYDSHYNR
jgi:hypothetical protein